MGESHLGLIQLVEGLFGVYEHLARQLTNSYAKVLRVFAAKNWATGPYYNSYHFIICIKNAAAAAIVVS